MAGARGKWVAALRATRDSQLMVAAAAAFVLVFVAFLWLERPGLGIGHGYYVAIVLAAMSGGVTRGMVAGVLATVLYAVGVVVNPRVPPTDVPTVSTAIRLVTYVLVGGLIGHFAGVNRRLLGGALSRVDELSILARRDPTTRLPNVRGFEQAISRRLQERRTFVLLVGDAVGLQEPRNAVEVEERMQLLNDLGHDLARHSGRPGETARIGPTQFAILLDGIERDAARALADEFERLVAADGFRVSFGWSLFPADGEDALSLYRAADERLYARKVIRGEWPPPATTQS